jgi:hypothetical protein
VSALTVNWGPRVVDVFWHCSAEVRLVLASFHPEVALRGMSLLLHQQQQQPIMTQTAAAAAAAAVVVVVLVVVSSSGIQ